MRLYRRICTSYIRIKRYHYELCTNTLFAKQRDAQLFTREELLSAGLHKPWNELQPNGTLEAYVYVHYSVHNRRFPFTFSFTKSVHGFVL
jgi:hypothetical protein